MISRIRLHLVFFLATTCLAWGSSSIQKPKAVDDPNALPAEKFIFVQHPDADTSKPEYGTELMDINDYGEIVGGYTDKTGTVRGFYLTETGLDDLPTTAGGASLSENHKFFSIEIKGASFTRAYGINNNGLIVGVFKTSGYNRGFYVTIDQVILSENQPIILPPENVIDIGGIDTQALGVNNLNTIVGGFVDGRGLILGFVLEPGSIPEVVEVSGGNITVLSDITDDGFAVGSYGDLNKQTGFLQNSITFVWDLFEKSLVVNRSLGFNGTNSALGINNEGTYAGIVGESETCSGNISFYENMFAIESETSNFIQIPERRTTAVAGINNNGMFVGATDNDFGALVGFIGSIN